MMDPTHPTVAVGISTASLGGAEESGRGRRLEP